MAASVAFQMQVAEAAMLIDTPHLHAYRAAADVDVDVDETVARGEYSDYSASPASKWAWADATRHHTGDPLWSWGRVAVPRPQRESMPAYNCALYSE